LALLSFQHDTVNYRKLNDRKTIFAGFSCLKSIMIGW
jgi:hypothetical protein